MEMLDKILAFIMSANGAAATVAVVLEFALRMLPSEKPLSIAHLIALGLKKCGAVMTAAADLMDRVLPQKVLPPK